MGVYSDSRGQNNYVTDEWRVADQVNLATCTLLSVLLGLLGKTYMYRHSPNILSMKGIDGKVKGTEKFGIMLAEKGVKLFRGQKVRKLH